MSESPSTDGVNGDRGAGGRFAKGNRGGPGDPYAAKVARIRAAFLDAVPEEDIRAIVGKMVDEAKAGNLAAAREIFQRTIGAPDPLDMVPQALTLAKQLHNQHPKYKYRNMEITENGVSGYWTTVGPTM